MWYCRSLLFPNGIKVSSPHNARNPWSNVSTAYSTRWVEFEQNRPWNGCYQVLRWKRPTIARGGNPQVNVSDEHADVQSPAAQVNFLHNNARHFEFIMHLDDAMRERLLFRRGKGMRRVFPNVWRGWFPHVIDKSVRELASGARRHVNSIIWSSDAPIIGWAA